MIQGGALLLGKENGIPSRDAHHLIRANPVSQEKACVFVTFFNTSAQRGSTALRHRSLCRDREVT
jgi:hypothetical protein